MVHVECKNYTDDISNAEFDQMIARFDNQRGRLGMVFYRTSKNIQVIYDRCRDAALASQGIVLPIDDEYALKALGLIATGNRNFLDQQISDLYRIVIS